MREVAFRFGEKIVRRIVGRHRLIDIVVEHIELTGEPAGHGADVRPGSGFRAMQHVEPAERIGRAGNGIVGVPPGDRS